MGVLVVAWCFLRVDAIDDAGTICVGVNDVTVAGKDDARNPATAITKRLCEGVVLRFVL